MVKVYQETFTIKAVVTIAGNDVDAEAEAWESIMEELPEGWVVHDSEVETWEE